MERHCRDVKGISRRTIYGIHAQFRWNRRSNLRETRWSANGRDADGWLLCNCKMGTNKSIQTTSEGVRQLAKKPPVVPPEFHRIVIAQQLARRAQSPIGLW
jgi:hypothetical protein